MKKNYLIPKVEKMELGVTWALCTPPSKDNGSGGDPGNVFGSAPKRRTQPF